MAEKYLYKKEYVIGKNGNLVLSNPLLAYEYINNRYLELINNINDKKIVQNIKLEIIRDLVKFYNYDKKNSIYPEPFGTFEKVDKNKFILNKILLEDMALYLGNIYSNFHYYIIKNKYPIPTFHIDKFPIDYNEMYYRALDEYFFVLLGGNYPRYVFNYLEHKEISNTFINIINGNNDEIPNNDIDNKLISNHSVYGTPYMILTLIEKFLINQLKIKLIYEKFNFIKELVENNKVKLNEQDKIIYDFLMVRGNKKVSENINPFIYDFLRKYKGVDDNTDYKLLITGECIINGKKHIITLSNIMYNSYAKENIKKEYLTLLNYLFSSDLLNLRNNIMHGNNSSYNYFNLIVSSILIQLLWDIINNEIFIEKN